MVTFRFLLKKRKLGKENLHFLLEKRKFAKKTNRGSIRLLTSFVAALGYN